MKRTKLSRAELIKQTQNDSRMNNREIAKELRLTESQVRYAMHVAMQKLRAYAKEQDLQYEDYFD